MPRPRYQTRLDADHAERVDDYATEHDISQSEAVRRLIVAGLDAETQPTIEDIREDLQEIGEQVTEDEGETHVMGQIPAHVIGYMIVALSLGLVIGAAAPV